jgi:hypothetical protein
MPQAAYIIKYDSGKGAGAGFLTTCSPSSGDPHILDKDILTRDNTRNAARKGTGSRDSIEFNCFVKN